MIADFGLPIACLGSLGAGGGIEKEPQHERSSKVTCFESSIRLYPRSRCLMIFNLAASFRCRGYNMRFQGLRLQRTSLAHLSAVCVSSKLVLRREGGDPPSPRLRRG